MKKPEKSKTGTIVKNSSAKHVRSSLSSKNPGNEILSQRGNTKNNYLPHKPGDLIDEEDVPDVDESE